MTWRLRPRVVLALLVFTGYVAISRAAVHVYPFSIFDMYSRHASSASRIVARGADGSIAEVSAYDAWSCAGELDVRAESCGQPPSFYYVPYKDEELAGWVRQHSGTAPGAVDVDVVRRIWWLDGRTGEPPHEDCLITHCRAVRR